jgi:hypothetical protein
MVDQFATQIPSMETKVKNLIADQNVELHTREMSLERTTAAKYDFQRQSTRLKKKLKGRYSNLSPESDTFSCTSVTHTAL